MLKAMLLPYLHPTQVWVVAQLCYRVCRCLDPSMTCLNGPEQDVDDQLRSARRSAAGV